MAAMKASRRDGGAAEAATAPNLEPESLRPADRHAHRAAIEFATGKHAGQSRKGSDLPYIVHPLETGALLARYYPGRSSLIAAGFLHDTLEDTATSRDELVACFGAETAGLVAAVTKRWWKPPWSLDVRDPDVVRLKAADCCSNIRATLVDLASEGPRVWSRFRGGERAKRDYYRKLTARISAALPDEPLVVRLGELAAMLEAEASLPR
jgi:(p)ppGpp synthase/HD superfamily hydrolase